MLQVYDGLTCFRLSAHQSTEYIAYVHDRKKNSTWSSFEF